jgi:hypothetical protein
VAALAVFAGLLVVLVLALAGLPCGLPGGGACAPEDEAAQLVPGDSLAYLHANLDSETEQAQRAAQTADGLPTVSAQVAGSALELVPGAGRDAIDFADEIEPWFGGEIALALLESEPRPETVALFEVSDAEGADAFASRLESDRSEPTSERVGDFLAVGDGGAVAAVRAVAEGETDSLADSETVRAVLDELPEQRIAEAYASPEGASELVGDPRGALGSLAPFVDPGATEGAAAAVAVAEEGELEVSLRSDLDSERAEASPGFFAAFEAFEPGLTARLSTETLAYIGVGDPGATLEALLSQASAEAPALAAGFEDLLRSLERGGGIDVEGELADAFTGEAALALQPAPVADGDAQAFAPAGTPYVEFVTQDVDEARARAALAAFAGALGTPAGESEVEGVTVQSVQLSPTTRLAYAVFDGLAVAATDPAAISEQAAGDDGLAGDDRFERATSDLGDSNEVSLLAYLDLAELIALGEGLGLAEDPVYASLAGEIRTLEALGLSVTSDGDLLATDARLVLDD